jgi:hypothetical protein
VTAPCGGLELFSKHPPDRDSFFFEMAAIIMALDANMAK